MDKGSPGFWSPLMLSMLYKVCITFTRIFLLLIMLKNFCIGGKNKV